MGKRAPETRGNARHIAYLIQYGRVQKYEKEGAPAVSKQELLDYYRFFLGQRELDWKDRLGGVNWKLSFDQYKEAETTKHCPSAASV